MRLELVFHEELFGVCQLGPDEALPEWLPRNGFCSITRTDDELSIVCAESSVQEDVKCERGWRMLSIAGAQAFTLTGVLNSILEPLAKAEISIFAISTFNTDYVLVKAEALERAVEVLQKSGLTIRS